MCLLTFQRLCGITRKRYGTNSIESEVDYADAAKQVAEEIDRGQGEGEGKPQFDVPGLRQLTETARRLESEEPTRGDTPGRGYFDQADVEGGRENHEIETRIAGAFEETPGILVHPDVVELYESVGWDVEQIKEERTKEASGKSILALQRKVIKEGKGLTRYEQQQVEQQ